MRRERDAREEDSPRSIEDCGVCEGIRSAPGRIGHLILTAESFRAICIVAVVVVSIFAGARVFEPQGVRTIPINRAADAVLEGNLGMPTKLAANLRTVEGVASIVAGAILDVLHQGLRFAEIVENGLNDFQIRLRSTRRNVVNLAGFSF